MLGALVRVACVSTDLHDASHKTVKSISPGHAIRLVVGWVRHEGEDWAITMRRMNGRLDDAKKAYPVRCWCDRLATIQYKLAWSLARKPSSWALRASSWHPPDTMPHAARGRGRPLCRWDDPLNSFANTAFGKPWIEAAIQNPRQWHASLERFVEFMRYF